MLVVSLVFTTAAGSCASSAAQSGPPTTFRLKYIDQNDPRGWEAVQAAQPWLDQIEAATQNRVQIDAYYSESLTKGANAWDAARNDLTDIGWMFHGYWADRTTLANVISLPLLPFTSAKQASGILWQLYQKYPSLRDQFKENHVLITWASTPYFLGTSQKQVKTLDDLKGLRIRIPTGPPAEIMKALGAVPVSKGMPDTYLYLQNGIIDGIATSWESLISFKQYKLIKYYTYIPMFSVYFSQAMSEASWNRLPADIHDQINSVSNLRGSLFWGENMFDIADEAGRDLVQSLGYDMQEYTIPEVELARWNEIARPIWESWVDTQTADGYPEAREILETTLELIKTYQP